MKYTEKELEKIAKECMKYMTCDTARVIQPTERLFLIIGFKKNTKGEGQKYIDENNEEIVFDYVDSKVVASGFNKQELIESAKEYERLINLPWKEAWEEFFKGVREKIKK